MNSIILSLVFLFQPAQFEIQVDTNTEVIMLVGDERIEAGKVYQLNGQIVPITIKYLSGEEIITKQISIQLIPGKCVKYLLKIYTNPPLIVQV